MLPVPASVSCVSACLSLNHFRSHNLCNPEVTFNEADAAVLADLSPLIGPDVPQGRASPRAEHGGAVRHPSSFGLLRQRGDELIHDGRGPAPLVAVVTTANQHVAICKQIEREDESEVDLFLWL